MARGNCIVVTHNAQGRHTEAYVASGETHYPGMIVQIDPTVALKSGRHTAKIYNRDADGDRPLGPFMVCTEKFNSSFLGKPLTEGYGAGERASYYIPEPGDELNLLLKNLAGTADDHTAGEILMVDDGTGLLIATTGTPETEVAVLKENVTDPTSDTLAWCEWSA